MDPIYLQYTEKLKKQCVLNIVAASVYLLHTCILSHCNKFAIFVQDSKEMFVVFAFRTDFSTILSFLRGLRVETEDTKDE